MGTKLYWNQSVFDFDPNVFFLLNLDSKTVSSNVEKHVHRTKPAPLSDIPGIGIGDGS